MLKIGLTGSIGSGKSTVSEIFSVLSIPVYAADTEAKRFLFEPMVKLKIAGLFGKEAIDEHGEVNKPFVANIVFNDAVKLEKLNAIIHPLVLHDFECWTMLQHAHPYVIHEAAILFESGFNKHFDGIITVTAPEEVRIQRVIQRDGVTEDLVKSRIQNQFYDEEKVRRADYVIVNDEVQLIIPQVLAIHQKILETL